MSFNIRISTHAVALAAVILSSAAFLVPAHAQTQNAASPVTLRSEVKVERMERDADGNEKTTLHTPNEVAVVPGDNVVFTLFVNNTGAQPAVAFKATNPMPAAIRFTSVTEDWADVSVDGGRSYGKLANLKVKAKDTGGTVEAEQAATADDVTHVRWVFAESIPSGAQRTVSYRGVVK